MKLLEPVDLLYNIRVGQSALVGGLDPTMQNIPYWNCGFAEGQPTAFWHSGAWDRCHDVPRAIHGLSMAEEVTGERVSATVMGDLSHHLFGLFDEADGLPGCASDDTGERFIHLHNIREATHALTHLIRRGDGRATYWAERMVGALRRSLDDAGRIHLERLPKYVEGPYNHQPAEEGRAVDAMVRYYRVTGSLAALEVASLASRFALENCFTDEGVLTEEAGRHGHSINALVAGMLDLALLTDDAKLLLRAKAVYDRGLPRFNSSFGWSMESLDSFVPRGESNNTGDLLRASLLLGHAGFPEYFERAERILRSHLLPSQVTDVDGFSDDPNAKEDRLRSLASRIKGGWSLPTPNDLLTFMPDGRITTYDITSGAVDALCEAWRSIITESEEGIRVNLLLSCARKEVRVKSSLSGEGRVEIENASGRNLLVRVPSWAASDVRLRVDGHDRPFNLRGAYLPVAGSVGRQRITMTFPLMEARTVESVCFQRYTIDWRGDQITAMSPPGKHLPMFPEAKPAAPE